MRWSFVAAHTAHDLWDDEGWEALSARHLQLARDVGALGLLPIAIAQRVGMHLTRASSPRLRRWSRRPWR